MSLEANWAILGDHMGRPSTDWLSVINNISYNKAKVINSALKRFPFLYLILCIQSDITAESKSESFYKKPSSKIDHPSNWRKKKPRIDTKDLSVSWSSRFLNLYLDTKKKTHHDMKARSHLASTYAFAFSKIIALVIKRKCKAGFFPHSLRHRQHHHRHNVKILRKREHWRSVWTDL